MRREDELIGGAGSDKLIGNRGDDLLVGGVGTDELICGSGADRFPFESVGDSRPGSRDEVVDFDAGEDLIDLSAIGELTFVGTETFTGKAGEVRFDDTILQVDTDGAGGSDCEVEVVGSNTLNSDDFLL